MDNLADRLVELTARLASVERSVDDLRNLVPSAPNAVIEEVVQRDDPDHNMSTPISRSIERCGDADSIYVYGVIGDNRVDVTPARTDFPANYRVAMVDEIASPKRIVWGDLSAIYPSTTDDVYVKVSSADTLSGFLYGPTDKPGGSKIACVNGVFGQILNPGGDEQLEISGDLTYLNSNLSHAVSLLTGGNDHDVLYNNGGTWTPKPLADTLKHIANLDPIRICVPLALGGPLHNVDVYGIDQGEA